MFFEMYLICSCYKPWNGFLFLFLSLVWLLRLTESVSVTQAESQITVPDLCHRFVTAAAKRSFINDDSLLTRLSS